MPERNIELLQQVMQHIKDHPEKHEQAGWVRESSCGTAACFAGWAALLSGWTVREIQVLSNGMYDDAGGLLGLKLTEALSLFDPGNTVPMLELMVKDLINGDELKGVYNYWDETHPL